MTRRSCSRIKALAIQTCWIAVAAAPLVSTIETSESVEIAREIFRLLDNATYRAKDWYTTRQETAGHFSDLPGRSAMVGSHLAVLTPTRKSFRVTHPHQSRPAGSRLPRCSRN